MRTKGPEVDRAWQVVELSTAKQSDEFHKLAGHLWKPLRALMEKAKHEREKALAEENTMTEHTDLLTSSIEVAAEPKQPTFSGTDSIMNMDFGMDRLYPNQTQTSNIATNDPLQNPTGTWHASNFNVVPSIEPVSLTGTSNSNLMTNLPTTNDSMGLLGSDMEGFNSATGAGWSPTAPFAANDSTMILDDGTMNWATWDDMVRVYATQNEAHQDGQGSISAFYTTGSNLF